MRQKINSTVREKPGIHFRELQRDVGCSSTTLNHHLPELEVKEREIHGYRRLYPEEVPEEMERPLAALNHSVRGRMLYYIGEEATPSGLVEKLDVSKSTVSTHLKILREDGVISEESEG
ncbi:MAG: ArsR family transcriptional regulator, partial [Candidatus Nanohalobium sp.]